MANRNDDNSRDNTGGDRRTKGNVRGDEIEEAHVEGTGHPSGGQSAARGDQTPVDMPGNTDPQREQHTRKGQAQSPRELNTNQPEKKHVPEGRG
jgi:hypothetical protein